MKKIVTDSRSRHLVRMYLTIKMLESAALGWFFSTYTLFLLDRGLTPTQTTQVNMAFMMGNFFFDLPTGVIADVIGQVPIYLLGVLVLSVGLFSYGMGSSYLFFIACEGASSIGTGLMSEALESLLTNTIGVDAARFVFSKQGVYARIATIPTAVLGSLIAAKYGLQYPWFLAGITLFVTFIFSSFTLRKYHTKRDPNLDLRKNFASEFLVSFKTGLRIVFGNRKVLFALSLSLILSASVQGINMFWAPILQSQAGATWWLGFLWAGIAIFTAFGSWLSKKLNVTISVMGLLLASIAAPIILTNFVGSRAWLTAVLFVLHEIGRGAMPVIVYTYINRYIPNQTRTSTNCVMGSIDRCAKWLGLWTAGVLASKMFLLQTWLVIGIVLLGASILAFLVGPFLERQAD
jgi:MFS family permease